MLRDGAAGLIPDLQRPDDALFVPQVQLLRRRRINAPQLLQQRLRALLPGAALQLLPQLEQSCVQFSLININLLLDYFFRHDSMHGDSRSRHVHKFLYGRLR